MSVIQALSSETINQIAAGEVIERPVSIIKELLDNSLDAKATQIQLHLTAGGIEQIKLSDNGHGILKDDLEKVARTHYTSKLTVLDQLYQNPALGFRGEAMASIAHVATLSICTCHETASTAYKAVYSVPDTPVITPSHHDTGTTVIASNLFANLPVRQKYLKSAATEYRHSHELIMHYALLFSKVDFRVYHNGTSVMTTNALVDPIDIARSLFGKAVSKQLLPLCYGDESLSVTGFISSPQLHTATRSRQFLSVNNRPVRSLVLNRAISDAYREQMTPNRHPFLQLNITVPHDQVDINIHPQKRAVRFLNDNTVYQLVKQAIKERLSRSNQMPLPDRNALTLPVFSDDLTTLLSPDPASHIAPSPVSESPEASPASHGGNHINHINHAIQKPVQSSMPVPRQARPYLQVFGTYIMFELNGSVWVVDQHAIHERILYEKIRTSAAEQIAQQRCLEPIIIPLQSDLLAYYQKIESYIHDLGFESAVFGTDRIIIRSIPRFLIGATIPVVMLDILTRDKDEPSDYSMKKWQLKACKAAIKAGKQLAPLDVTHLIEDFMKSPNNYTCPHGRPLFVQYDQSEFDAWFKRR